MVLTATRRKAPPFSSAWAGGGAQRTASPDRSDLALELTFGNQKHLSSYAMDRLDEPPTLKRSSTPVQFFDPGSVFQSGIYFRYSRNRVGYTGGATPVQFSSTPGRLWATPFTVSADSLFFVTPVRFRSTGFGFYRPRFSFCVDPCSVYVVRT